MLVIQGNVVERIHLARDMVSHGDDAHIKTAAELHIRLALTKEQHVAGISPDVDYEGTGDSRHFLRPLHNSAECLRVDEHMVEHQAEGLVIVGEAHRLLLTKILRKAILENTVMLRRQPNGEIDIQCG